MVGVVMHEREGISYEVPQTCGYRAMMIKRSHCLGFGVIKFNRGMTINYNQHQREREREVM